MTIKAFDTAITFTDTLTLDGTPFSLSGCTVKFVMRLSTGGGAFSDTATPDADQTTNPGVVTYTPGAGFPTVVGTYNQEWEVTTGDEKILTFPGDAYNPVRIIESLNEGVV